MKQILKEVGNSITVDVLYYILKQLKKLTADGSHVGLVRIINDKY